MKPRVFIDGREGTTGLQISDRLKSREDIELLLIDEDKRKDPEERKKLINLADLVFLCLPDKAAIEAVTLLDKENKHTKIIDASTAHRTNPDWAYGFSELSYEYREKIINSQFVANPGCHATGVISVVYPLVELGIIDKSTLLTAFSLTGYSGGGKKMIAEYEADDKPEEYLAPRAYGLSQEHKHIPEIVKVCGLDTAPVFLPIVDDYYKGMETTVMLHREMLKGFTAQQICDMLFEKYRNKSLISVIPQVVTTGMLSANTFCGKDTLEITVCGNDERITVISRFDNLGKGASGAAVQNMNLMLGFKETEGLSL